MAKIINNYSYVFMTLAYTWPKLNNLMVRFSWSIYTAQLPLVPNKAASDHNSTVLWIDENTKESNLEPERKLIKYKFLLTKSAHQSTRSFGSNTAPLIIRVVS